MARPLPPQLVLSRNSVFARHAPAVPSPLGRAPSVGADSGASTPDTRSNSALPWDAEYEPVPKRAALDVSLGPTSSEFEDCLRQYYTRLFPFERIWTWLSHGRADAFAFREFSLRLEGDILIRYQSYETLDEFRKAVLEKTPLRIEFGAICGCRPRDIKKLPPARADEAKPVERELTIDIDLSDYDDVRTCCQGGACCKKCWWLAAAAVKVLDTALRQDFGFQAPLWFYSGRRGVHCIVCDARARALPAEGRHAVVSYLSTMQKEVAAVGAPGAAPHPYIARTEAILRDLARRHARYPDPVARGNVEQRVRAVHEDRVRLFTLCAPRIDASVATQVGHLLKLPFCVHPGTRRVCVPLDVDTVEDLDPADVPTLDSLLEDLDRAPADGRRLSAHKRTGLARSLELFDRMLAGLRVVRAQETGGERPGSLDDVLF
jgi:DNA primase small subunit